MRKMQGGFQVAAERCDQCLFSKDAIVDSARRRDILRQCAKKDCHFVCHKYTIDGNRNVCCRGFYDRNPEASNLMRIAGRLGAVTFVPLPVTESLTGTTEHRTLKD